MCISTSLLNLIDANIGIAIVPDSMQEVAPRGVRFVSLTEQESASVVSLIHRRDPPVLVAGFAQALVAEMSAQASGG